MLIAIGFLFLVWVGVFAFLWEWALKNVNGWWGVFMPLGWFILVPCIVAQVCIWIK